MVAFAPAGPDDASAVHAVTRRAYEAGPPLDPPAGALRETLDDVAADLAAHGGVLGTGPVQRTDRRAVARCAVTACGS